MEKRRKGGRGRRTEGTEEGWKRREKNTRNRGRVEGGGGEHKELKKDGKGRRTEEREGRKWKENNRRN